MCKKYWLLLVLFVGTVLVIGVYTVSSDKPSPTVSINVASSLEPVMKRQVERLGEELPGRVRLTSAGSQTVARQIANGKPADIVFLANVRWMDHLERNKRIRPDSRRVLLGNELVLIGPASDRTVSSIADLQEKSFKLGLGNVTSVPVGIYGRKTLESMGLRENHSYTTVMFPHVRAVLSAVSSGEIAAGIVYRTDLSREQNIRPIETFPDKHVPAIEYPIALVKESSPLARQWYDALVDESAYGTYREFGFEVSRQ